MNAHLTLTLDEELIERARAYSESHGASLSSLVAAYLSELTKDRPQETASVPPITRALRGSLKGTGVDEEDYRDYLRAKFL